MSPSSPTAGLLVVVVVLVAVLVRQRRVLARHRTESAALVERLEGLAHTDPMTGLANRRRWDAELARAVAHAVRAGEPLCVALLDLDHFKTFNDRHGHVAGDALLRRAADLWAPRLRAGDLLARWGGEEFAVLLPACTPVDAARIAADLTASTPEGVTCSAGVAALAGPDVDELLRHADAALYRAKASGRAAVAVHEPGVVDVRPVLVRLPEQQRGATAPPAPGAG